MGEMVRQMVDLHICRGGEVATGGGVECRQSVWVGLPTTPNVYLLPFSTEAQLKVSVSLTLSYGRFDSEP